MLGGRDLGGKDYSASTKKYLNTLTSDLVVCMML
jgi:hypothetical protein